VRRDAELTRRPAEREHHDENAQHMRLHVANAGNRTNADPGARPPWSARRERGDRFIGPRHGRPPSPGVEDFERLPRTPCPSPPRRPPV
jgi:hypothetical protein